MKIRGVEKAISGCIAIALVLVACQFFIIRSPVEALDLDPYRYFDVDYCITFTEEEVEEEEVFYLEVTGQVECIEDLPVGANQAGVTISVIARHKETGVTEELNTAYGVTVSSVPDWKGDTYEFNERVELVFPGGSQPGGYDVIAQLVQAEIDGWEVTDLIPESSRSRTIGEVTCIDSGGDGDGDDIPEVFSGYLILDILGNTYLYDIMDDGSLAEPVNLNLVEGKITLRLEEGAVCLNRKGEPLDYILVSEEADAPPYEGRFIIDAYRIEPYGAEFEPYLELELSYDKEDLPDEVDEEGLFIAYYKKNVDKWIALESQLNSPAGTVITKVNHFTTFALVASSASSSPPEPALFVVANMSISPAQVEPGQTVTISAEVRNDGGMEGSYTLNLTIGGELEDSRTITLAPGEGETITYQVGRSVEGEYAVTLGEQSGKFTVVAASLPSSLSQAPAAPLFSWLTWLRNNMLPVLLAIYFFIFVL